MRICMVGYNMNEFGGLEEFAVGLAVALRQQGHQVSFLSAAWGPSDNQYIRRLYDGDVTFVQIPRWIWLPACHWPTKERIREKALWILTPLIYLLGGAIYILKRKSWFQSLASARSWLQGQLMTRIIGPDRYKSLTRLLLNWWRLRWRPEVIHIHGYTSNLLFVIEWANKKGVPVVYEEQQTPDPQFDWWKGFQSSINKATIVVAVSEKSVEGLRNVCGVTRPIVVEGPLILDPIAMGWKMEGKPQKPEAPIVVTSLARLYVTKGLPYLLEAIVKVKAVHPTTQFKVYGDGPLREELLDYASKLGLDGSQIFVGSFTSREELSHIMAETDIFAMSSILEGQPLSLVEAMSYGCPIVATRAGGIPELIHDGVNGLLCDPGDPDCLAQKLNQMIENPDLRERLGIEARKSYEDGPFQPAAVCGRFISIYNDALYPERIPSSARYSLVG
jgi:glycosyltransferase involved in cell wall biosynthesis